MSGNEYRPLARAVAGNGPSRKRRYTFRLLLRHAQRMSVFAENGGVIGQVEGDALVKAVRASVHQLRRPPAWACDLTALRMAKAMGATRVVLCDGESGQTWETALEAFWGKDSLAVSRGWGEQRALPLSSPAWTVREPEQLRFFQS